MYFPQQLTKYDGKRGDETLGFWSAFSMRVRDLRKQLTRCDSGTDSIVWMEEDGETVSFLLSFLIAPEADASGIFFKEESIWKT